MYKSLFIATILVFLGYSIVTYAESFTICKGENRTNCPSSVNFVIPCNESETPVIENECTVTENATPRVLPYKKLELSVTNGDKCGYTVWKAECHPMPVKTFTICKGENKASCPSSVNFVIPCNESETPVIENECTVTENATPRVLLYKKSELAVTNGDKCGYTVWKAECINLNY